MKMIWVTPDRFHKKPDKSSWIEMALQLRHKGHEVIILTSGRPIPESLYDVDVQVVGALDLPLVFRITALFNMVRWLRLHARPKDVIIINPDALWLVPLLRMLGLRSFHLDVRTVPVEVHSLKDRLDRLLFWSLPLKWLGRSPISYSFITERLKGEVDQVLSRRVDDYVIWQSGVNGKLFRPSQPDSDRRLGRLRLFYHGTLSLNRGIDTVISALPLLDPGLDAEFVVVGEGRGAAALKALTRRLGLEGRVVFKGLLPYENMAREIHQADLCICPLPDRLEWNVSSPLKIFEYMACAKPMILTPIAAHLDVVEGEPFVVWSDGSDQESLRLAIERGARELDSLTKAAVGGPALVAQRHDWSCQARSLERHLNRRYRGYAIE